MYEVERSIHISKINARKCCFSLCNNEFSTRIVANKIRKVSYRVGFDTAGKRVEVIEEAGQVGLDGGCDGFKLRRGRGVDGDERNLKVAKDEVQVRNSGFRWRRWWI